MNKSQLIDAIASRADLSKVAATKALEAFTTEVSEQLREGGKVELTGFGKFEVRERAARTGRNPKTGESIEIAATKSPAFKPGKALKDAVNA